MLTLRISEAPDLNSEKMTKNACEKIVELAQQVNSTRCAMARKPDLEYNTQDILPKRPLHAASGAALPAIGHPLFSSVDEIRNGASSLTNFIRTNPDIEAGKGPNSELKIVDFGRDIDLTHRQKPYKISRDGEFCDSTVENFIAKAPDAIVTTTDDGFIQGFNEKAEQLFAYKRADVQGFHVAMLLETNVHLDSAPRDSDCAHQFRWHPVTGDCPIRGRKKTGELFPIEVFESQYGQNGTIHRLFYIKDLTQSSRQEQRIAELECEIAYLSRHSVLGELATTITHELSQPLTAITNYTAAAMRCLTQPLPEQRENGLDLIVKAGDQAKRAWLIMHRLRKLLQHRGIECVRDDLRVAVEEAVQLATLGADRYGIQVNMDLPPEPVMVSMDRVHIQVLVTNLIRNAIDELSVSDGEKTMWIRLRVLEGNLAELSVEDTGAGIAPEIYENIFDPFHTTKPQGLGVGLAVSRRIAQAHGGRLSAENRPEGGAVFRFVVPMSMSEKVKNE
jgi:two-component system sensor kinase FixL